MKARWITFAAPFVGVLAWGFFDPAFAQTHFRFTSNTGNNATVAVPITANPNINGAPLVAGDEIGAFTPLGLCVGAIAWNEVNGAITVWGDNDQTPEVDGIQGGERIHYRVWKRSTNTEFAGVSVTYSRGDGTYTPNGLYVLSSLNATAPPEPPLLQEPADGAINVPTSPSFSWNASNYATAYHLQVSLDTTFGSTAIDRDGITGTSFTASGLANNTRYFWWMRASNSGGYSSFSPRRSFTTVAGPPSPPVLLSPQNGSVDQQLSLMLSWTASAGATSYRAHVATDSGFNSRIVDTTGLTSTSLSISGLSRGTTYFWRVRAVNEGGESSWSTRWSFVTLPNPPLAPTLSSPSDGSINQPTTLTLTWNSSSGASFYRLQVATMSDFAAPLLDDSTLTATSRQVSSLANNTRYFWRVKARNEGGTSNWATAWNFTTGQVAPSAPTLIAPTDGASNQQTNVTLRWGSVLTATSYHLQVSMSSVFSPLTYESSTITDTTQQLSGLENGKTYFWRIRAANQSGSGPWSSVWSFSTAVAVPAAPTLASPPSGAIDRPLTPLLFWNRSTGATSYRVQISATSSFNNQIILDTTLSDTTKQASGLSFGTTYHWRVNASNASGTSNWSNIWNFTTVPEPPAAPTLSSPPNNATNQPTALDLQWNASTRASSYELQVSTFSTFDTLTIDRSGITTTSSPVSGLRHNTSYFWRVRATNAGGTSLWSTVWRFTTAVADPLAPSLVSPPNGATGISVNATLEWSATLGATSYRLQLSTSTSFTTLIIDEGGITSTTKSLTGLTSGTTYYWKVQSNNSAGSSGWSTVWSFTTAFNPPSAPALLSPQDNATDVPTAVTLQWQPSSSASSYRVQLSQTSTFGIRQIDQGGIRDTSFSVAGLSNNAKYYWRVQAMNPGGTSGWSTTWAFTTIGTAPLAPSLALPANGATGLSTKLLLTWNEASGAQSYRVIVSKNSSLESPTLDSVGITNSSLYVGQLQSNLTYYWQVTAQNSQGESPSPVWSFTTADTAATLPLRVTLNFPRSTSARPTDYRLVGFPGGTHIRANRVLTGMQGIDWRLFWDNGLPSDFLKEFDGSEIFTFSVGRGFWLIHNGPVDIQTNTAPAPLNSAEEVEIPLHPGWNIITNPLTQTISWSAVQSRNTLSVPIYAFEGTFSIATDFSPFKGYYLFNEGHLPLLTIPKSTSSTVSPSIKPNEDDNGWILQMILSDDRDIVDRAAWLGVSGAALSGKDGLDFHKPRAIPGAPSLSFRRPDWDKEYDVFASDIRPHISGVESWDFEINAPPGSNMQISFAGVEAIPKSWSVYLVDLKRHRWINLRRSAIYAFVATSVLTPMKILVGSEGDLQRLLDHLHLPLQVELGQNYPNPFNLRTIIPFAIPTQSEVELAIYNLLGQRVRTLIRETMDGGYYDVVWDGKDDSGRSLSSGVYIAQIRVNSHVARVQTMMFLK
ncbi:MAG TPA: fibronectin type III domain-containing protein [Bacteroidota bacterium]|nr:fibronectin type III domain-containing protein [Bacteroidota bacterium]